MTYYDCLKKTSVAGLSWVCEMTSCIKTGHGTHLDNKWRYLLSKAICHDMNTTYRVFIFSGSILEYQFFIIYILLGDEKLNNEIQKYKYYRLNALTLCTFVHHQNVLSTTFT